MSHATVEEKPEGAPEWMVSYADMITIMMSFFVIMFAIASGEAAKGKRTRQHQAALESIQYRFGPKWQPFASWGLAPGNSPIPNAGAKEKGKHPLPPPSEEGGTVKIRKGRARIRVPGDGDHIAIGGVIAFDDAAAELADAQKSRLQTVAQEVAGKAQEVEVVGHVSNRPLPEGALYRDRWDLAYARCRQVAQQLTAMQVEPERIRIAVVQTNPPPGSEATDARVDVYLSDSLPEQSRKQK